jgi:hypothetical protein
MSRAIGLLFPVLLFRLVLLRISISLIFGGSVFQGD